MGKVLDEITSWNNLLNAYEKASKRKHHSISVMNFKNDLSSNLFEIEDELKSGNYRTDHYHSFYVYEPKKRMIMALPFRDRVVQWAIYNVINPYLDKKMIYHSYACREGKGQLKAAKNIQRWIGKCMMSGREYYYLKMDISKFFYRVDHKALLEILDRYYHDETELMKIFDNIINCEHQAFGLDRGRSVDDTSPEEMRYDVGLPIGNLTSQLFANVYLNELDQYVKHVLKVHMYERYMDDIAIFMDSLEDIKRVRDAIIKFTSEKLHLDFNDKTTIGKVKNGITFVGCRIFAGHMRITDQTKKKMKKNLIRIAKKYANYEVTYDQTNSVLMSYYGILKHVENKGIMKWISNNFVLQRNRNYKQFKQKVRTRNERIKLSDHASPYDPARRRDIYRNVQ